MSEKPRKPKPERPLDATAAQAFREVLPAPYNDNPRSAIEAADDDVDDTIGGSEA